VGVDGMVDARGTDQAALAVREYLKRYLFSHMRSLDILFYSRQ
jgi:hypothetical protein